MPADLYFHKVLFGGNELIDILIRLRRLGKIQRLLRLAVTHHRMGSGRPSLLTNSIFLILSFMISCQCPARNSVPVPSDFRYPLHSAVPEKMFLFLRRIFC